MKKKLDIESSQSSHALTESDSIDFSSKPITPEEAHNLSEIMLSEQNFKLINFNSSSLSQDLLQPLSYGMLSNRSITSIDIGNNLGIARGSKAFKTFLKALNKNPITSLNLHNIDLDAYDLQELALILQSKPIQFLDLSMNNMAFHIPVSMPMAASSMGFSPIESASLITRNPYITSLNLSGSGLTSQVVVELAKGLTGHPTIKKLELNNNYFGGEWIPSKPLEVASKGLLALMEAIAPIKSLQHIGLAGTGINFDGFGKMLKALEYHNNKTLCSINLSNNTLWSFGAAHVEVDEGGFVKRLSSFQDVLSWKSKSITHMDLSGTFPSIHSMNFREKASKFLGDALKDGHNIKVLNLSNNMLSDKAMMNLIKVFKASSLEELDLSNNNITGISSAMLEQVLNPYTTLVLSNHLPELIKSFTGKGDKAEMIELTKVLGIKGLVKIVEEYCSDEPFPSGKFIVPGVSKSVPKVSEASKALESIVEDFFPSKPAGLICEYHGDDFVSDFSMPLGGEISEF